MISSIHRPCDENVIRAGAAATSCTASSRKWVLVATILGSSMGFIDGTVVNIALPALQTNLNATVADVQWVVEAYSLFLAALLLVGGSLGDRYGRRRIFVLGVILFATASAWCGFAGSIGQLIAARAVQGIGAALLVPGSLSIISSSFKDEERGRAIGTWSGFSAITAAVGPVLGGWIVDHVSWRAVFFINIPLAVLVIIISLWRVPESTGGAEGRLDWWGAAAIAVALGALVFALIESPQLGFTHWKVMGPLLLSGACLAAFFIIEARSRNPMLPLALFRSRNFNGANLLTLFLYSALGGTLFFLPLNLIQVQRYTPTQAGAALLPLILIIFLLSRWSGGLAKRVGAKIPLIVGPLLAAGGFALFLIPSVGGSYWSTFFPAVVVLGIGMAISVAPLTTTVMDSVAQAHVGVASGANNAISETAGLLAVAVFGIIMLQCFGTALDTRLPDLSLPASVQASLEHERNKLAGADLSGVPPGMRVSVQTAINESFVHGFRRVALVGATLALASALAAGWLISSKRSTQPPA
jgi:EmrB/QacA subfamily drug resistance transporter